MTREVRDTRLLRLVRVLGMDRLEDPGCALAAGHPVAVADPETDPVVVRELSAWGVRVVAA